MKHGTSLHRFTLWMEDQVGKEKVQDMLASAKTPIKMYKKDYEEMLKDLNEQIKTELKRIGQ